MSFYVIKSELSGLVLDVEGGSKAGHKVIPWDHHGKDNQVWYDNPNQGTICSKSGNYCLAVTNNQLCVEDYHQGHANQQWVRDGPFIRNRVDHNKVIDVFDMKKEKGSKIADYAYNGGANQKWVFDVVPGQPPVSGGQSAPHQQASTYPGYPSGGASGYPGAPSGPRKEFLIVSEMNGKIIDIDHGKKEAGTKILMWTKNSPPSKNQLWYEDGQGFIRSAHNDMVFTSTAKDIELHMSPATGDPKSQWRFDGNKIVNSAGECVDIKGGNSDKGTNLCAYKYQDSKNQHWKKENV